MILTTTAVSAPVDVPSDSSAAVERQILDDVSFRRVIARERSRTDRSAQPFLLMLVELGAQPDAKLLDEVLSAVSLFVRDTDVLGWYVKGAVIGILFTEISPSEQSAASPALIVRVMDILHRTLTPRQLGSLAVSCHSYPDCSYSGACSKDQIAALYPDLYSCGQHHRYARIVKRAVDILGSSFALLILSPVLLLTALLVKISSRGPIIFRQERLGLFGSPFKLLKFRSMRVDTDHHIHREFMKSVIAGTHTGEGAPGEKPVYKMTDDPRITPIGKFIRRYSLDELPQFLNVLRGEMSLVGPRPPLKYEYEEYQLWHRHRVLIARPGITGLWQVQGRSRVSFDDMVRLDLEYVHRWTPWLDMWILLKTPAAVMLGKDAF